MEQQAEGRDGELHRPDYEIIDDYDYKDPPVNFDFAALAQAELARRFASKRRRERTVLWCMFSASLTTAVFAMVLEALQAGGSLDLGAIAAGGFLAMILFGCSADGVRVESASASLDEAEKNRKLKKRPTLVVLALSLVVAGVYLLFVAWRDVAALSAGLGAGCLVAAALCLKK